MHAKLPEAAVIVVSSVSSAHRAVMRGQNDELTEAPEHFNTPLH